MPRHIVGDAATKRPRAEHKRDKTSRRETKQMLKGPVMKHPTWLDILHEDFLLRIHPLLQGVVLSNRPISNASHVTHIGLTI